MPAAGRRKTSLTLDAAALDSARELGINVSRVAETAPLNAIEDARRKAWLDENRQQFEAQAEWHAREGHPLAEIMAGPGAETWKS